MKNKAKKTLFQISLYQPGRPIDEVKRQLGLKDVIKLASNENPYSPSAKVLAAIRKASQQLNRYPDGGCYYLRQALAKQLKVDSQQLIFGNGSDELIVLAARAFLNPKDEVVLAKPSFLIYEIASRLEGAVLREIPLQDFKYDLKAMKKAVNAKTKIIFLGNPDNPAGTYFTTKDITDFLKGLRKGVLIFIDEAYFEYVEAKDYVNSLRLLKQYKNIIVTRTFSKMYGLAGLRIGYGIADPSLIDILNRVREPFNVNSLAQTAAIACLEDKKYYDRIKKNIRIQRQYLYSRITRIGFSYVKSFTNFILINVGKGRAQSVAKELLRKGIIIRDMTPWGMKDYIRVSIGTAKENKRFMEALKELK